MTQANKTVEIILAPPAPHMVGDGFRVHNFFPSGYTSFPDGTDEQALFNVAKQMYVSKIPFSYLTEAYRKLYSRQFALDLADELDAADLTRFYSFFNKGIGNITTNLL